jgi:hypothetical protein
MDHICVVLPLLAGKTADAREFMRELEEERKREYEESERRIGITREHWFLAETPSGPQLVAYMESNDFNQTFAAFSQSRDEFDLWFKRRLAETTGLDMNNPPPDLVLPEHLSSYVA